MLSVLVGPSGSGVRAWRRWADGRGYVANVHESAEPGRLVPACVASVARGHDLRRRAVEMLARECGRDPTDLHHELAGMTLHGLEQLNRALPAHGGAGGTSAVVRRLCRAVVEGILPDPEDLAADFEAELLYRGRPHWRVLVAIDGLLARAERPAMIFSSPTGPVAAEWLAAESHHFSELVESVPGWPVAVSVAEPHFEAYSRSAPDTRAKALLTGGVIRITPPDAAAIAQRLREAGVEPDALLGPVRRLEAERAPEEVVEAFAAAAAEHVSVVSTTDRDVARPAAREDRARSAAERFLFELLDALPRTAGRFTLNPKPGFPFGGRAAEIDLCAESLRLAVEVDGYHHFTDPDAYRRDRRKDWELQRHGYVVLRVLAADVVERMEDVLDRILAAVDHCLSTAGRTLQGGDPSRDGDRHD